MDSSQTSSPKAATPKSPACIMSAGSIKASPSFFQEEISLQSIPNKKEAINITSSTTIIETEVRDTKLVTNKGIICFAEIYERIDQYFDHHKVFDINAPENKPQKSALILKPCPKIEKVASFKLKPESIPVTNKGEEIDNDLKGMAVPSFLAKRSLLQRAKTEKFTISTPQKNICNVNTPVIRKRSEFANIESIETTNQGKLIF